MRRLKIKDFLKYDIYENGDVYSYHRNIFLKPIKDRKNYLLVMLCDKGRQSYSRIARLVASAFVPNPQNKSCVNHIDGNKQNNHHTNLEWVTRKENDNHARRTGLNNGLNGAKLNEGQVKAIRVEYPLVAIECIAKQYSVSQYTIRNVVKYKTWRHIK